MGCPPCAHAEVVDTCPVPMQRWGIPTLCPRQSPRGAAGVEWPRDLTQCHSWSSPHKQQFCPSRPLVSKQAQSCISCQQPRSPCSALLCLQLPDSIPSPGQGCRLPVPAPQSHRHAGEWDSLRGCACPARAASPTYSSCKIQMHQQLPHRIGRIWEKLPSALSVKCLQHSHPCYK